MQFAEYFFAIFNATIARFDVSATTRRRRANNVVHRDTNVVTHAISARARRFVT
jgi:hypothetical protein